MYQLGDCSSPQTIPIQTLEIELRDADFGHFSKKTSTVRMLPLKCSGHAAYNIVQPPYWDCYTRRCPPDRNGMFALLCA